jgi:hypothetical protein
MKKPSLHVVSTKAVRDKYTTLFIYMCDESVFEFDLDKHEVTREDDWVNVEKLDNSALECFQVSNIMRVKFEDVVGKQKLAIVKPLTQPPDTAA